MLVNSFWRKNQLTIFKTSARYITIISCICSKIHICGTFQKCGLWQFSKLFPQSCIQDYCRWTMTHLNSLAPQYNNPPPAQHLETSSMRTPWLSAWHSNNHDHDKTRSESPWCADRWPLTLTSRAISFCWCTYDFSIPLKVIFTSI